MELDYGRRLTKRHGLEKKKIKRRNKKKTFNMTQKELKLTKEEAIVYYNSSNDQGFKDLLEKTFGKDFWKSPEIWEKVNNFTTLLHYLGSNPLIYTGSCLTPFEKYINACVILAKVAEIYNGGEKLDWKNTNKYKYMPYKYFSGGSWVVGPAGGWGRCLRSSAQLYYKNSLLSEKSYNNFKEYWEDFWSFNE